MPCSQPGLKPAHSQCWEEQRSPGTPREVPAGPVKDSLAWSQNESLQEIWELRRRLAKGFAYCFSTDAHSHCSVQLCPSYQCWISYHKGHACP